MSATKNSEKIWSDFLEKEGQLNKDERRRYRQRHIEELEAIEALEEIEEYYRNANRKVS